MPIKKFNTVEEYWDEDDINDAVRNVKESSKSHFGECLGDYLGIKCVRQYQVHNSGLMCLFIKIYHQDEIIIMADSLESIGSVSS